MYTFIAVVVAVFAGIIIIAGAAILIYGIRQRMREKSNCTRDAVGVVKEKIYDDTVLRDGPEVLYGAEYTCGLRMLISIDGVEYDVFNKIYDTAYYKYNEGDLVPVKVNPDDPTEYYVSEVASQGVSLYLIGAGMIVFGAYLIKVFWF